VTDVIGTGHVEAPPRRRLRVPRWASWVAVLAVVIGAFVVPAARAKLADRAAAWLLQQWSQRAAYDDARAAVIGQVVDKAGALDEHVIVEAAAVADREEARALSTMAHRLTARRMWAGDVSRTRDTAVAALRFEVRTLLRDAGDVQPTAGYLFTPSLDKVVAVAAARIASMARHRHLHSIRVAGVQLPPVTSALDRLRRPTDFPTGLSVVTDDVSGPHVVDLNTGAVTNLPRPGELGTEFWDGGVALSTPRGVHLLDAHGRTRAVLGHDDAVLLSVGGPTVWLRSSRGVRRFDVAGRPLTRWIPVPAHWMASGGAGRFVVLGHFTDEGPPQEQLWDPLTGVRRELPFVCFGGWISAGNRLLALPCEGDRVVTTLDLTTGKMHRLRLPAPVSGSAAETLNPMSPSGDRFTVVINSDNGLQAELLDLRSGRLMPTPIDIGLAPVGWSADGQWVLLAESASLFPGRRAQVALWRPGDGRMTSVRLPVGVPLMQGAGLLSTTG